MIKNANDFHNIFIYFKLSKLEKIRMQLNNFIRGNAAMKWLSNNYIETDKMKGGLGFFNPRDFIGGLKLAG